MTDRGGSLRTHRFFAAYTPIRPPFGDKMVCGEGRPLGVEDDGSRVDHYTPARHQARAHTRQHTFSALWTMATRTVTITDADIDKRTQTCTHQSGHNRDFGKDTCGGAMPGHEQGHDTTGTPAGTPHTHRPVGHTPRHFGQDTNGHRRDTNGDTNGGHGQDTNGSRRDTHRDTTGAKLVNIGSTVRRSRHGFGRARPKFGRTQPKTLPRLRQSNPAGSASSACPDCMCQEWPPRVRALCVAGMWAPSVWSVRQEHEFLRPGHT